MAAEHAILTIFVCVGSCDMIRGTKDETTSIGDKEVLKK